MQKLTRRWWRYNIIKKKNLSNLKHITIIKILKLKKIHQITYSSIMNLHFLNYKLLKYRGCLPKICFKSAKFKKIYNFSKLNRWNLLKSVTLNKIPNLKKFVW